LPVSGKSLLTISPQGGSASRDYGDSALNSVASEVSLGALMPGQVQYVNFVNLVHCHRNRDYQPAGRIGVSVIRRTFTARPAGYAFRLRSVSYGGRSRVTRPYEFLIEATRSSDRVLREVS
jgi:hypothetical protein